MFISCRMKCCKRAFKQFILLKWFEKLRLNPGWDLWSYSWSRAVYTQMCGRYFNQDFFFLNKTQGSFKVHHKNVLSLVTIGSLIVVKITLSIPFMYIFFCRRWYLRWCHEIVDHGGKIIFFLSWAFCSRHVEIFFSATFFDTSFFLWQHNEKILKYWEKNWLTVPLSIFSGVCCTSSDSKNKRKSWRPLVVFLSVWQNHHEETCRDKPLCLHFTSSCLCSNVPFDALCSAQRGFLMSAKRQSEYFIF